jgi:hypothetical protein
MPAPKPNTKGLSHSERKVVRRIKRFMVDFLSSSIHRFNLAPGEGKRYDFWFLYNDNGDAISWEGGWELSKNIQFRNQYSIKKNGRISKNWD